MRIGKQNKTSGWNTLIFYCMDFVSGPKQINKIKFLDLGVGLPSC